MSKKIIMIPLLFVAVLVVAATAVIAFTPIDDSNVIDDSPAEVQQARQLALDYLFANYDVGLSAPSVNGWTAEYLTPEFFCGGSTWQYTQGEWAVTVEYAIVLKPAYDVVISYADDPSFQWIATVQEGTVTYFE
jgi:hypothetical protein